MMTLFPPASERLQLPDSSQSPTPTSSGCSSTLSVSVALTRWSSQQHEMYVAHISVARMPISPPWTWTLRKLTTLLYQPPSLPPSQAFHPELLVSSSEPAQGQAN